MSLLATRLFQGCLVALVLALFSSAACAQSVGIEVNTSPTISGSFDVPADAEIAVGWDKVVVIDNDEISVWSKPTGTGTPVRLDTFQMRDNPVSFWDSQGADAPFDPRAVYDPVEDRFWLLAMEYLGGSPPEAYFYVAVTQTGDPTGTWNKFRFDAYNDFPDAGYLDNHVTFDFTNFAVGEDWVYITAWTRRGVTPFPVKSPVWMIKKSELMPTSPAPQPPFTTLFQHFDAPIQYPQYEFNHRATQAPVVSLNPNGEPQYFVGVDPGYPGPPAGPYYPNNTEQDDPNFNATWNKIALHAIKVVAGPAPQRHDFVLTLPEGYEYKVPSSTTVFQPGFGPPNGIPLRLESARFWATPVFRDDYIWATHHVRDVDSDLHEVRWYKIEMNGWPDSGTPALEEWGTIAPNEIVNGVPNQTMFASVAVNYWHDMMIAYHEVGGKSEGWRAPAASDVERHRVLRLDQEQRLGQHHERDRQSGAHPVGRLQRHGGGPGRSVQVLDLPHVGKTPTQNAWKTWLARNHVTELCSEEFGPDYSRDGTVDIEDTIVFDDLYQQRDGRADYNRDRTVDGLDYVAFLNSYSRQR